MAVPAILVTSLASAGIAVAKESLPKVIDAFVTTKKVDKEVLLSFIQFFGPTLAELTDALETLSKDQALVSSRALEVVKEGISYCKAHLACCTSPEERAEVTKHVIQFVNDARRIADADRSFRQKMFVGAKNPFQPQPGHEDSLTRLGARFGEGVTSFQNTFLTLGNDESELLFATSEITACA